MNKGQTTELQRAKWEASMRHQPKDYSLTDKIFRHPVVLVVSLTGLAICFFSVVFSLLRASGVL